MTEGAPEASDVAGAARAVKEARSLARPLRRLVASVLDSPVAESDAREILAGWRIALWMTLLVAALAAGTFLTAGYYFTGTRPFPALVAKHGIGALLVAGVQLTTIAFLSLAVPLRASGLLEGPRWRGYFDQLVASGVAPWRYFAGRALVAQAVIGLVLVATVPVLALFWVVDPADAKHVLVGALLTVVWAELLLAVALGLSVLLHELAAVLLTLSLAGLLQILAWTPLPSALVALCPTRWVLAPFAATLFETDTTLVELMFGAPRLFGVELPYVAYAIGLSLAFASLAALPCVFGPLYAFLPGFNNFGAVVLPGDRTRATFRRVRPVLQRRVELAFFFENRGPRLARIAPLVRVLQISALLFLVGALFIGTFANGPIWSQMMGSKIDEEDLLALVPITLSFGLLLAPFLFATSRNDAHLSVRLGPLAVPVVLMDLIACAVVHAGLGLLLLACLSKLAPSVTPRRLASPAQAFAAAREWIGILSVVGWTAVVIAKSIGLRTHGRGASAVLAVLLLFLVCAVLAVRSPEDVRDQGERAVRTEVENARLVTALHIAWPLRMVLAVRPDWLENVRLPAKGPWRWLAYNGFWAIYPALDVLQLGVVLTLLRKRRAEARAELEAIAKGAAA